MKPPTSVSVVSPLDRDEEKGYEAHQENDINEWKLAAAVLDRTCAIAFTTIFVVGKFVFVILLTTRP